MVVDDTAVTPAYVHGLAADRELPIIKRIATGSLRNKLLFIVPAALLLSAVAPVLVEVILICGGLYLAYEGAHKIHGRLSGPSHDEHLPAAALGPDHEEMVVKRAVRTDFILSAEIMVIALKDVLDSGFVARAAILVIVAVLITAVVYGVVALIVKMDDFGLALSGSSRPATQRLGRSMVHGVPKLLAALSLIGTAAMCWVGGHILLVGADELGWHWPYDQVHRLEEAVQDVSGVGGVLAWLVNTGVSALVGVGAGFAVLAVTNAVARVRRAA